jgi:hypothetical protein
MTEEELLDAIRVKAAKIGGQSHLAKEWHISPAYLSDVLNQRRSPGESILSPLGLERIVTYRKRNGK